MSQPITGTRAEAVASWTLHYEANPAAARARLEHMRAHGVPEGHTGEMLGASIALTPPANRCEHYGDRTNCVQCQTAQWAEEDAAKRQARAERRERAGGRSRR